MITAFALLFCFQGEGYFERVSPYIFNGDVRSLPRMAGWKPGDPLFEIPRRSGNDALVEPQNVPAQIDPLLSPQRIYDQSGLLGGLQILQNVAGQANTGSNVPDANGQAGLTYYIQVVNRFQTSPLRFGTAVQIYNKSDMSLAAGPFVLDTLGSGDCSAGLGDPCVIWDYQAERWIISEMSRTKLSLCVYVSQTADPLSGGWFHYSFNPPNALDYPHIAVWGDSYIVTTNENKQAIYAL
ncbi:MAG: hypothetical protein KDC71_24815, partial [Acidobacteria bacterium]|nr:hypothetical protein [Acidobacteriota bacterium]